MTGSYAAAVFVIVPIDNVMTAIFDGPVTTVGGKHAFRVGLFSGSAGNAIGDVTGVVTGFFISRLTLDDKSLCDVGKVQIVVEFGCGPNFTDFDAAVIRRVTKGKIGLLSILKI